VARVLERARGGEQLGDAVLAIIVVSPAGR
jgi:hypothetical protein